MNMNVNEVKANISENMNWFEIGYEMVQNFIKNNHFENYGYCECMNELLSNDERLLFITLMKKLVGQVNNGGFAQYFYNGYASFDKKDDGDLSAHESLIELYKKYVPKNEKTEKLFAIMNNFMDDICRDSCDCCDGTGYYHEEIECDCHGEDEDCSYCGGTGYIEDEGKCCECNGTGELNSYSYQGNDDEKFYDIFDSEMEQIFKDLFLNWLNHWEDNCVLNQWKDNCILNDNENKIVKPKLKLIGTDGNAFSIIAKLSDCLRHNGYNAEQVKAIQKECMSGDYNNVIATACKYCEVY